MPVFWAVNKREGRRPKSSFIYSRNRNLGRLPISDSADYRGGYNHQLLLWVETVENFITPIVIRSQQLKPSCSFRETGTTAHFRLDWAKGQRPIVRTGPSWVDHGRRYAAPGLLEQFLWRRVHRWANLRVVRHFNKPNGRLLISSNKSFIGNGVNGGKTPTFMWLCLIPYVFY